MKIVEVISDTNIGGAGILLCNRLECTDLNKYPTVVFLPRNSRLIPRLERIGVKIVQIDSLGDRSWSVGDVKKYKIALKKIKPDIINCHGCLSARVAAKAVRIPVKICTRHCVFPVERRERAFGIVNNWLSDVFIAVAHSAKQNLMELGIKEHKIHVIINGSKALGKVSEKGKNALKRQLGITDVSNVLVMCARLEKCKGHVCLLQAIRLLEDQGISCVAIFVGEGSEEETLKKACGELGIQKNVIFVGFADDVSPYMSIADININCSVGTETSSLALSEGMSLGLPAVVSDYGGNPYMVRDGVNGYVYRMGDAVELAERIKKLIYDKETYTKMRDEALKRFDEELNCAAMTKKTNRLYDKLLGECHRTEF